MKYISNDSDWREDFDRNVFENIIDDANKTQLIDLLTTKLILDDIEVRRTLVTLTLALYLPHLSMLQM